MKRENRKIETREYDLGDSEDKAMYDEMLDECSGPVEIGSLSYPAGDVLAAVDPIAYRCGFLDYVDDLPARYLCPECGEEHEDEDEARGCCITWYDCPECGEEYEDEDEARGCCITWYDCPECGEEYDSDGEAAACCHSDA